MEQERDFKGVWIPKAVWLDKRLSALDKFILSGVASFCAVDEYDCFASNKAIADFCGCSESKVTKSISQLASIGYLQIKSFNGRERRMNIPPKYAVLWRDYQDG